MRGLAALALALVSAGALAAAPRPAPPVWPAPPDTARIEFVTALTGPHDFGSGLWKRLGDFAGGSSPRDGLAKPTGIAVSADGQRVYVVDGVRLAVFRFDFAKRRATALAFGTSPHGPRQPFGLAIDGAEDLYVTDQATHAVVVMSPDGRVRRALGADSLRRPVGCAVDTVRRLIYVADAPQGRVAEHRIAVFALDGRFVRWIGGRGIEPGRFNYPTYIAVDAAGQVHVVDSLNWRVQVFSPEGALVRVFGRHGDARGDFDRPKGVALDRFGNVYVADSSWDRVLIFSRWGRPLLDFGGRGTWPGGLQEPTAVAWGGEDRIYVADTNGHRVNVYRLVHTTAADSIAGPGSP
jgi:DNA-binding beta-propeller fold protein YncE